MSESNGARGPVWPRILRGVEWVAVGAVLIWAGARLAPQVKAWAGIGTEPVPALPFQTTGLDGRTYSLESLHGQVVVLNFWATWCLPCRVEMPALDRLHAEGAADGVIVIGVATDREGRAAVDSFLAEHGYRFPITLYNQSLHTAFGPVDLLPTTVLIDRSGRVRHRVEGFFAPPALSGAVDRLVGEPAAERPAAERPPGP